MKYQEGPEKTKDFLRKTPEPQMRELCNKYSLPIYTNRLKPRKRYFGAYVAEGATPYVILFNTPCDPQFATA